MYQDNPMAMVMEKWQTYYFGDNSFGRPIIGTKDNINSFTQQMLFDHKAQLYTKDNLIIMVAGKIVDKQAVVKQLEKEFIHIAPSKQLKKPVFTQTLPQEHTGFFEQKNEQAHLVISAPGYDGNDEHRYAANVLGTIL
jgi:predicted Zn-dependent peptidase